MALPPSKHLPVKRRDVAILGFSGGNFAVGAVWVHRTGFRAAQLLFQCIEMCDHPRPNTLSGFGEAEPKEVKPHACISFAIGHGVIPLVGGRPLGWKVYMIALDGLILALERVYGQKARVLKPGQARFLDGFAHCTVLRRLVSVYGPAGRLYPDRWIRVLEN
jgi:hypothetical protein